LDTCKKREKDKKENKPEVHPLLFFLKKKADKHNFNTSVPLREE
jgi:hypothetical protein